MKIYDTKTAPSPRRVRIFLAEKGIDMDYVQVDIVNGQNLSPEMRAKNPLAKVPILELDDGTCISETLAIFDYFETLYPDTPRLMGTTALERALISQWHQRAEGYLLMNIGMCFQHSTGAFKDRMTPVPEYGKVCGDNAAALFDMFDQHLATHEFLAGDALSIADITAYCAIDFARVIKLRIQPEQAHLQRWFNAMKSRPSARA